MGSVMDQERPWERDEKPEGTTIRERIETALRSEFGKSMAFEQIIKELERIEARIPPPAPSTNVMRATTRMPAKTLIAVRDEFVRSQATNPDYDLLDHLQNALDEHWPDPSSHVEGIKAAQITMGRGLVDVTRIDHEGRAGILFRPRGQYIPVGDGGELQAGGYWPVEGDVVIWIENEGGAQVIQTYLTPFLSPPPQPRASVSATPQDN